MAGVQRCCEESQVEIFPLVCLKVVALVNFQMAQVFIEIFELLLRTRPDLLPHQAGMLASPIFKSCRQPHVAEGLLELGWEVSPAKKCVSKNFEGGITISNVRCMVRAYVRALPGRDGARQRCRMLSYGVDNPDHIVLDFKARFARQSGTRPAARTPPSSRRGLG